MRVKGMELPSAQRSSKIVILLTVSLILLTLITLNYPFVRYPSLSNSQTTPSTPSIHHDDDMLIKIKDNHKCDIFTGEWVPNPDAPYYQNGTCWAIFEYLNCAKYGRPDSEFMKWKWKPDGCDLPIFNPYQFLELMRDKSMAFIGDSVGRNQMQSLICLLSRVEYPIDISTTTNEQFKRWSYDSYNFTLATFWSPFLIKEKEDPNGLTPTGVFNLYLDEIDENWMPQVENFDYLIINGGHWFMKPAMYYEKGRLAGCKYCQVANVTDLPMKYGFKKALKTVLKAINSLENFKGMTIMRTFAPLHYEGGGDWNTGADCIRTKPFKNREATLEGVNLEMYMVQMKEFRRAEREGKMKGNQFRLLDITQAMLLRPDGHPSKYGHWPNEDVSLNVDCVHWCLPGPIDTWADFLLHMIKMDKVNA